MTNALGHQLERRQTQSSPSAPARASRPRCSPRSAAARRVSC